MMDRTYFHGRTGLTRSLAMGISLAAMGVATAASAQSTGSTTANAQAAPDQAQATPAPSDDIVVTAQFREQKLQDTPIAITAVNAEMMEARSQTNLAQVADSAPNVQLKPQGASFGPSITASIRGIGQNDFNPAYEPGVAIYIDDVYYPQLTGAVFDLLDLDRVEILRGPQGTLTGRNSEGGAIKMYSRKPTGENGGYVEATYGSRNRLGLRASADFKLTDTLFGRISGVFKRQEGYVDRLDFGCVHPAGTDPLNPAPGIPSTRSAGNCRISKLGGVGYQAVRGTLRWTPASNFELTVIGDYTHDEHTIAGEVLLDASLDNVNTNAAPGIPYDSRFICGRFCNYITTGQPAGVFSAPPVVPGANGKALLATSGTDISIYDGWGVSAQAHWAISDTLSLDSISGYRHFETTFDSDDDLSPANIGFGMNDLKHWDFSQEVRLGARFADTVNVTLGGFYFKQSSGYSSFQDLRYVPVFPLQFSQPDVIDAEAKAGFAHVAWEITPGLNLSGGIRYTDESKEYHYFRLNADGTINRFLDPLGVLTGSTARYKASRWDYRASVDYRFSPALLAYATFSTGFKGGGTNPRPFNANQIISFDPETLTAYEVGVKSDLFDRLMRLNLSAFYNDYKGIQIPVLSCPDSPCAARLNAGDAHVKGFEAELTLKPTTGLLIDASLSYLDFKYTRLTAGAAYPTNPGGAALTDPSGAPKWKWTAGAQYRFDIAGLGSITPRLDLQYQDKLYTGPSVVAGVRNLTFIPAYTIGNARVTWRNEDDNLELALEVTNLFNKYYYLNVFDLRGAGAGFKKGQPGRPREWAVTLKKKF